MPAKFITPPLAVWGDVSSGVAEQLLLQCFNNSSGSLAHGDVVVVDNSAGQMPTAPGGITGAITTTTSASDLKVLGPISMTGDPNTNGDTEAVGNTCFVCVHGVARVQIAGNTVAAGGNLATSGTAKVAATPGTAGSVAALQALIPSFFAAALESQAGKDAYNTIRCLVKTG